MKLHHFLTLYRKINSEWVKNLNITPETITFLEENTGGNLFDISLSIFFFFLDIPPQARATKKAKINKWDYIKLKSFLHREGNYQQNKKVTY